MRDFSALRLYYAIGMLAEAKERHCGGDNNDCRTCKHFTLCCQLGGEFENLQPAVLDLYTLINEKGKKNG